MRHKIKPVDISIVSSYMGRFLTAIVAAIVFAITIHAWMTRGDDLAHVEFAIGVTAAETFHEPLRELVAEKTARRVSLAVGEANWDSSCEVYVLPLVDYLRLRRPMRLRGLFALGAVPNDRALVVTKAPAPVDAEALEPGDILFEGPAAANGCWAQLMELSRLGKAMPAAMDRLHYAGSSSDGARVVYSVVDGASRFGACRGSDVERLVALGRIRSGDLAVALETPALPEFVVAAAGSDADYFAHALGPLGALVADPGESARRDTVLLLRERGIGSFRPISPSLGSQLDSVAAFVSARSAGSDSKWDN